MICIAYFWCCYDLGSGALGGGLVIIVAGCLFTRVHAVFDMDRYKMVVVLGQDFIYHSSPAAEDGRIPPDIAKFHR